MSAVKTTVVAELYEIELYLKVWGCFFLMYTGHIVFSYFHIPLHFWPKVCNSFCLPYLYYAKICSNERNCAPLESFCIFLRTLAKCQCQTHYNFKVFPLPGKRIYFLFDCFNLRNWDKWKTNKTKISFPVLPQLNFSHISYFINTFVCKDIFYKYKKFSGRAFSQYIF